MGPQGLSWHSRIGWVCMRQQCQEPGEQQGPGFAGLAVAGKQGLAC